MKNALKRCKTALKANTELKMKIKRLKISLKHADINTLDNILKKLKISPSFSSAVKHAVKMAKLKSAKGMRYDMDWLLECLLLRIKSPAAYKHLFKSKMLPVPHPSTLKRLISGQECQFGFNDTSLQSIELNMRNKPQRDRQGSLIFDEIKLRETLDFNKGTKKFDGYIDYAEYTDEILTAKEKKSLADHALVIMYRPLTSNWVQPIASFATKEAAKGNALQKIIMEAIIKLESVGAQVVNVVADGAKTNKNFWKLLGISGKPKRVVNKVQHPYDENRSLFFLCDVPHLIKCIRNHFRKYGVVQFNGKAIDFKYYEKLFEEDQLRQCGLRKCYKLTKSHINPNSFEKMNVSYATQLFSRSVATGIEFYRQQKVAGFEKSEDTQNFTLKMNNLFDALNGRFSKEGIRPNSPQLPILRFWFDLLQGDVKNNTFASSETLSALRITLKSVIEISEYLLTELEFKYVLTNKLNQDPCEKFFGLVRGAGGHEDHPTVCNLMQLYRILSLYTPTKQILNTNIAGGENETVLLEFQDSLKSKSKLVAKRKREWKDEVNKILESKTIGLDVSTESEGCHTLDANIVYYLSGYVVLKSKKFTTCQPCLKSLENENMDNLPNVADLSKILDYGNALKYPSPHLFKLLCFVIEPALVKMIANVNMYGDMVINILSSLSNFSVKEIGCCEDNHSFNLVCKIVPFYIVTRLYFYVRATRNDLGHGKATKNKRKMSKLQSI